MTLNEYIAIAKTKLAEQTGEAISDRELGRRLGFAGSQSVSHWRTGRDWPSDKKMVLLAEICGLDPVMALADLNVWRATGVQHYEVRVHYEQLRSRLAKVLALVSALFIWTATDQAQAQNKSTFECPKLYIMR